MEIDSCNSKTDNTRLFTEVLTTGHHILTNSITFSHILQGTKPLLLLKCIYICAQLSFAAGPYYILATDFRQIREVCLIYSALGSL